MRISVKLALSFLLIVALALGSLAVVTTSLINQRMVKLVEEYIGEELRAAWIQFYVRGDEMKFGMLQASAIPPLQDAVAARDERYLRDIMFKYRKGRPYVDIWAVTDERGVVIAKLSEQPVGDAALSEVVKSVLVLGEPAIKLELLSGEVIAACGDEMLVSKLGNLGLTEGMALVAVVPVFKGSKLVGTIVTADLFVEDFFVVDELGKRFPESVFLIAQGDAVISTSIKSDGKRALGIKLPEHLMAGVRAGETHRMVETLGGKNYFSASEAIRDSRGNAIGALLVGEPEERFLALQKQNLKAIAAIFFLALLVSAGIASVATREIVKPVAELAEATKKIKQKNFDVQISGRRLESEDEIGELASSFNVMALELKQLYDNLEQNVRERTEELEIANEELKVTNEELQVANEELKLTTEELRNREQELREAKAKLVEYSKGLEGIVEKRTLELKGKLREFTGLHEISDLFKAEAEPERIYGTAAQKIAELMDAEQCCIVLYDALEMKFAAQHPGYGISKENLKALNVPLEEAAHTLENWPGAEPLISNEPAKDERIRSELSVKLKERNLLLAKLLVGGKFLGILRVANKRSGSFTSDDARLAEIIASRLGAALYEHELFNELKESEEKYRLAIDNAADAIFLVDAESAMITETNAKAVELTGYSREELLGMKGWEVHPKEHYDACLDFIKRILAGESITAEMELLRKDGTRVPVEISSVPISHGGRIFIQRILRDITERKKYEEELKRRIFELERMHRLMVDRELRMKELKEQIKKLEEQSD